MESILIRKVMLNDINQLKEIGKLTFYETFSSQNTDENMVNYLEDKFSTTRLTAEINNSDSLFYFALINNEIIGYLKINWGHAQTEIRDENGLEIERIYVLQKFQGKHGGQLLYEKAIEKAKQKNLNYVWLGVWEENKKAINFYTKNSFVEFDKHIFRLGDDEQTDIMMKLQLK